MTFRPDVEGLRGIAVLGVLGFHAAMPFVGGGYVGVDVFFVVSGFLITGLLLRDIAKHGRFSLLEFYARRARRILPAAGVVLVATAVGSWLLLPPLRQRDVAWDLVAAASQVGNWRFVAAQTDYLAAGRDPSPVLHYWSLAVEEQFYLLWAPLLLGTALVARRRPVRGIAVAVAVVTAVSLALSLRWTQTSVPLAYLGSPSRAWQFGVGAALALATIRGYGRLRALLGWCGFGAIVVSTAALSVETAYPGTAALLPTMGTAAVIVAGPDSGVGRFLASRPLRAVGRLSFAWYLWHWPVLVLAEAQYATPPGWPVKLALVAASALPAWLTMRVVERPLRFSSTVSALPRRGLSVGATAAVVPVAVALLLGSGAVRTMHLDAPTTALPAGAVDGPSLLSPPGPSSTEGPVRPSPVQARTDYPRIADCQVPPPATTSPPCVFGDADPGRVVLFGDSHAAQWYPAVEYTAKRRGWAVEVLTKSGCPAPKLTVDSPQLGREYRECDAWREHVLDRLSKGPRPKLIAVGSLNRYTGDRQKQAAAWEATLGRLAATGAPIAYLRDTPMPGNDIPTCLSGSLSDWRACEFPRQTALWPDAITARPGLHVVDVNDVLCPAQRCPAAVEGILLYRDDAHLTDTAARLLAPRVDWLLSPVVAPAAWTQVWRDDFDGAVGPPSAANWQHDLGTCYPGCPAPRWGTGEIETMTDSTRNVYLDGRGHLAISPRREANGKWTSGRVETRRADFAAPSGGTLRVEASLRLPDVTGAKAAGYWPAFWMLGDRLRDGYTGWPGVGELDVMESVNGRGSIFAAMHCGWLPDGPCKETRGGLGSAERPCPDCHQRFHTYAVELDDAEARFYLDGIQHHRVTAAQVGAETWRQATRHGFFLILNVAIGGQFPGRFGGGPTAATASGRPMLVDHVAVYTRG